MIDYSEEVNQKLQALAQIHGAISGQVVAVHWPSPVGTHFYLPMRYDLLNEGGYNKITSFLDPAKIYERLAPNHTGSDWRLELKHTGGIDDDSVAIELGDTDFLVRNIYYTFGADCLVEVYRWLPEVELLLGEWWGFLDAPSSMEPDITTFTASIGVRSRRSQFPHRLRGAPGCQAAGFGGRFATQDEVNECGCPHNQHLDGAIGVDGFTDCPQLQLSDCTTRLGTDAFWLGSSLTKDGRAVVFAGAYLSATSQVKGNNTRSNQPFALMLGGRFTAYEMGVLDMIADVNTAHPERAARRVLSDFSEGPIEGIGDVYIDDKYVQPQHFQLRLGEQGQAPSGFVGNVNNYSLLAHASMATFGNDPSAPAESIKIRGTFSGGYKRQRIYSAPGVFTLGSTNVRAWNLRTALTNKVWGVGDAHGLYVDQDWIDLATTDQENLSFTDRHGVARTCKRSTFAHYFNQPQPEDEVIRQIALWGGYAPRIQFGGKYRIGRLDKRPDLESVPQFYAYPHDGIEANIAAVSGSDLRTSLRLESPVNPRDLTYQMNVSFCDESINFKQRTITIEDRNAQTDQGRKLGEYRFRQGSKQYFALGITNEAEVLYHAEQILACGEFFSGGLRCNQPISFNVWWKTDLLMKLHEYKIIQVNSWNPLHGRFDLPAKNDGDQRFYYYIILKRIRLRNNQVKLICQAYDETFFDREEPSGTPPTSTIPDAVYPFSYGGGSTVTTGDEIQLSFVKL
jgi:hypothetical protein